MGEKISHLLFVDYNLIFYEAKKDNMTYLWWLLMWSEACSRFKINFEKSDLFHMERMSDAKWLAGELGCKMGSLPTTCLGMPLGAYCKSSTV